MAHATDKRVVHDAHGSDEHMGAVEGDQATDSPQQGNQNATALDEQGMPDDPIAIAQDRIGADIDDSQG